MRRVRRPLHSSFLLLLASLAFAQQRDFPEYVATHWGLEDGLPQSSVNNLLESKDGYLWIATFGGLVRFDGVSFTVFDRSNTKGMQSDRILSVQEDREGRFWCSTEDGILRIDHGVVTSYSIIDNGFSYSYSTLAQDSRGNIWVSANAKPYIFRNERFELVPVIKNPALARAAVADPRGVWLFHRTHVLRTIGDSIVLAMDESALVANNISDMAEFPAGSGNFWIGTREEGVLRIRGNAVRRYTEREGLQSVFTRSLFVDREGALFVLGLKGIARFNGERFEPVQWIGDQYDPEMSSMIQGREGNYWVGGPANGLTKLQRAVITTIGKEQGLHEEKMLSLAKRSDGSFLFGTNCGGIYEWKNGKATYSMLNRSLINLCVWSIFEDSKKRVWVGSRVLQRFDDVTKPGLLLDSTKGFNGLDIFSLMEDSKGSVWIGCLNGLYRYDGRHFTQYLMPDGLASNDVRALFEDASGRVWIGTTNGLSVFEGGKLTRLQLVAEGRDSLAPPSRYVRAIHEDAEGTMWFGLYGGGIARLKNGRTSFITQRQGLYDNIVSHIIEDGRGNFWMGCNRGIFRARREDLNAVADGTVQTLQCYSYGKQDGMASPETNGGFQPSVISGTDGTIYFPTVAGVAAVAASRVEQNLLAPPVVIERIRSTGRDLPFAQAITLPYDSANIEIQYAALSFIEPAKNQYRYRIEGFDNDWVEAGNRRSAFYTQLRPGEWTFHVVGSNNHGMWNTAGASLHITVLPPFWMTWWFRGLIGIIFLSAGPMAYYYRVTNLKKEKQAQELFAEQLINSQEQERRRIAAELHDGLGQQILVIKNRAEIALRSVNDPEKTANQLREITNNAMSSMNDVRSIAHGLRPAHLEQFGLRDTLVNLCEQLQESSSIEWAWHIDPIDGCIPKEKEINFYRIVQEGTNNIMKHAAAAQATIMVRRDKHFVTASLWDNGKGFQGQVSPAAGLGLAGIQERTKTLGGAYEIKSAPGDGTTLIITIPIHTDGSSANDPHRG